jgi:hypothetical protein
MWRKKGATLTENCHILSEQRGSNKARNAMKPKTVGRSDGELAVTPPVDCGGLCADSIILTLNGEVRVGDLRPGMRVITRDRGAVPLKRIETRRVTCRAVRILAGSLGHTRPERDVILPAGQPILVRDWRAKALFGADQVLVPVARLVDGEFVTLEPAREILSCDLGFDGAHVLYVDGLELATDPQMVAADRTI